MTTRFKYVSAALVLAALTGLFIQVATAQSSRYEAAHHEGVSRPSAPVLPFEQLERIASREMAHVTELEVRDLLLKAKGYDSQGMKVEVLLDRRDGHVLSRQVKYPKHMQRYAPYTVPGVPRQ